MKNEFIPTSFEIYPLEKDPPPVPTLIKASRYAAPSTKVSKWSHSWLTTKYINKPQFPGSICASGPFWYGNNGVSVCCIRHFKFRMGMLVSYYRTQVGFNCVDPLVSSEAPWKGCFLTGRYQRKSTLAHAECCCVLSCEVSCLIILFLYLREHA